MSVNRVIYQLSTAMLYLALSTTVNASWQAFDGDKDSVPSASTVRGITGFGVGFSKKYGCKPVILMSFSGFHVKDTEIMYVAIPIKITIDNDTWKFEEASVKVTNHKIGYVLVPKSDQIINKMRMADTVIVDFDGEIATYSLKGSNKAILKALEYCKKQ